LSGLLVEPMAAWSGLRHVGAGLRCALPEVEIRRFWAPAV